MRKLCVYLLVFAFFMLFLLIPQGKVVSTFSLLQDEASSNTLIDDICNLFAPTATSSIDEKVYLGGYPIGITLDGDGVTVIGLNEYVEKSGKLCCPALVAGLQINDVVLELDGKKIFGSAKLAEICNNCDGKRLSLTYLREGKVFNTSITPLQDFANNQYRLGLWTRDSSSGIGTLTYVRKNLCFGSLGHPICDGSGKIVSCLNGGVFDCCINGVVKGVKGNAGELKGSFCFEKRVGSLYANNKFGAFGAFSSLPNFCNQTIEVADVNQVKIGKAQIFCTLEGNLRKSYDIEIVKANQQSSKDDKGMVIHITDKKLLEQTGGIVQGMSGSPIVQDGRLVGAVTHVFVNDPTRGYGMYAKWMLTN